MSASLLRRRIGLLEQSAPGDSIQGELVAARQFSNDPLGFVMWGFPWGQPGSPLEREHGPDEWQRVFLQDLGALLSQHQFDGINRWIRSRWRWLRATASENPH